MRGLVGGLSSPHPLGAALPAVFQEEDPFAMRLTSAFDDALAPIVSTLDNLPAYFDPGLTPEDFLSWLSDWVAFDLDETWSITRRREAVARAVDILRRRGTSSGLAHEVALVTSGEVEIIENGGTAWSLDPASPMVGSSKPALVVRIRVDDPSTVDPDRIDRLVAAAKPAHVPHRVEVLGPEEAPRTRRSRAADPGTPTKDAQTDAPQDAGKEPGRGSTAPKAAEPPVGEAPPDSPGDAPGNGSEAAGS